jgi:hypothetical protein
MELGEIEWKSEVVSIQNNGEGRIVTKESNKMFLRGIQVFMGNLWEHPQDIQPFLDYHIFGSVLHIACKLSLPPTPGIYHDWAGVGVSVEEKETVRRKWLRWWVDSRAILEVRRGPAK